MCRPAPPVRWRRHGGPHGTQPIVWITAPPPTGRWRRPGSRGTGPRTGCRSHRRSGHGPAVRRRSHGMRSRGTGPHPAGSGQRPTRPGSPRRPLRGSAASRRRANGPSPGASPRRPAGPWRGAAGADSPALCCRSGRRAGPASGPVRPRTPGRTGGGHGPGWPTPADSRRRGRPSGSGSHRVDVALGDDHDDDVAAGDPADQPGDVNQRGDLRLPLVERDVVAGVPQSRRHPRHPGPVLGAVPSVGHEDPRRVTGQPVSPSRLERGVLEDDLFDPSVSEGAPHRDECLFRGPGSRAPSGPGRRCPCPGGR